MAAAGSTPAAADRRLHRRRVRRAWAFLAPTLIVLAAVALWPLVDTMRLSLTDASTGASTPRFVGLDNYLTYGPGPEDWDGRTGAYLLFEEETFAALIYRPGSGVFYDEDSATALAAWDRDRSGAYEVDGRLIVPPADDAGGATAYSPYDGAIGPVFAWRGVLADGDWWRSVLNTVVFAVASVGLELVLGLIIALVLDAKLPGRGVLRAAVLVPWAIPTIVSARLWGWMLHDQYGVANEVLLSLGLIDQRLAFTAEPWLALPTVILVDVWKTTPFMALLILAGLQLIPTEVKEAARVDGVPPVRRFFDLTLPMIWPAILVALVFRLLDALRVFDLIYVLTAGTRETMSMSVYARQHLAEFGNIGYGSAAATVLFAIVALLTVLALMAGRFETEPRS